MMRLFLRERVANPTTYPSWRKSFWRTHFTRHLYKLPDTFEMRACFYVILRSQRSLTRARAQCRQNDITKI